MLLALAIALAAPLAASAAERAVSAGDLTLSRPADAQRMLRRLDAAALEVCGASVDSVRDQQRAVRRSACYAEAMDGALAAVNAPAATERYRQASRAR
jgi:UrcA family protein